MMRQLGEGEERKNAQNEATKGRQTGSEKGDQAIDTLAADEEIEPAEFFDPEEFGIRRRLISRDPAMLALS